MNESSINEDCLMGRLSGIAVREKTRAPMTTREEADVTTEDGIEGDFRGRRGKRQVTLLFEDAWQAACRELQVELPWTVRRANLLISDLRFRADLFPAWIKSGKLTIHIGDVVLRASGQTDPCGRMDEQHSGLTAALMPQWRGGICCQVVRSGKIRLGQEVRLSDQAFE